MTRELRSLDELLGTEVFCVVIPCYKVENEIESVIRQIPDWVDAIIAVDDGSPDSTGKILDRLATEIDRLEVLHHEQNQGVGGAMISGYKVFVVNKPVGGPGQTFQSVSVESLRRGSGSSGRSP